MTSFDESTLGSLAFLGETFGPAFLYEPEDERAQALLAEMAKLDVSAASEEWPFIEGACAEDALAQMQEGLRAQSDDLLWEYRRLFVGPARKIAPPWGSVYTDRECVVFGEATLELRQWMRTNGIARPGDGTEPEDHIGLMFLLMSWIARNRDELLQEYLEKHFLTWAPHFLEIVERETTSPFYEGLARLARLSLLGAQNELDLTVEEPRFYR